MPRSKKKRNHRLKFRRRTEPGAAPGTLVADPQAPPPQIQVIAYGPEEVVEEQIGKVEELREFVGQYPICWINVDGLGDTAVLKELGRMFGMHQLALEDVVHTHQRSKVEEYEEHLFVVARMVSFAEHLETEQISLFIGKNFVVTFQERPGGDSLDPVRERLRSGRGAIREAGSDFLAYAILDAVIDGYFPVLERLGDQLEDLDDELSDRPTREIIPKIHNVRRELLILRRAIAPHRDAVNALLHQPHPLISRETQLFLRDCYDHTVQIIDLVTSYRELCGDLKDTYLSLVSNRLNEVMKVLTIISTIFIPMSWVASVYGMNFAILPEKDWRWGYPFSLALMAALAGSLLYVFWRRGWLTK
jgi:magnesium transporter